MIYYYTVSVSGDKEERKKIDQGRREEMQAFSYNSS